MTGMSTLPPQLAEKLHAVHARHLDVEDRDIDRLGAQPLQCLSAVAVAPHSKPFRLKRYRHGRQNIAVVVDKSNRVRHLISPKILLRGRMIGEPFL